MTTLLEAVSNSNGNYSASMTEAAFNLVLSSVSQLILSRVTFGEIRYLFNLKPSQKYSHPASHDSF